jgi:hypothetical protein
MLFEKGDWQRDSDEEDDDDAGAWNLEALRRETEAARTRKEEERLAALGGGPLENAMGAGTGPGPGSSIEGAAVGS